MDDKAKDTKAIFERALADSAVKSAAKVVREKGEQVALGEMLELARSLSAACGANEMSRRLHAELVGYQEVDVEIPPERKALGFASPFPVRALDLGLLDPEEIFLANREKFSQVTLTIGQPIEELVTALSQIRQGGVLALRVPASEVTGESATTDPDTEVFIYILPREIQKIVDSARARALSAIAQRLAEVAV